MFFDLELWLYYLGMFSSLEYKGKQQQHCIQTSISGVIGPIIIVCFGGSYWSEGAYRQFLSLINQNIFTPNLLNTAAWSVAKLCVVICVAIFFHGSSTTAAGVCEKVYERYCQELCPNMQKSIS